MAKSLSLMNRAFLDTSFTIALSAPNDRHHRRAEELAEQMEADGTQLVTTRAILLETGNALATARYRQAAVSLLSVLEKDPKVEIVSVTEKLYQQAFDLYRDRSDKEWGLIDCMSFIVMSERKLTDALTANDHFRQIGFRVLLPESSP